MPGQLASAAALTKSDLESRLTVDYVRISRDRTGTAQGVESQHLECEDAADELNETISRTYSDNDTSAYSGVERPAYQDLIRDIKANRIKLVIFWHAKRLHRNVEEAAAFIRLARAHKVKLYSVSHGYYNLEKAQGRQAFLAHTVEAQGESEERGERVALARKRQARQGSFGGGIRPYGWGVDTGRVRSVCVNPKAPSMDRVYEDRPVLDMTRHRPEEVAEIQRWAKDLLAGVKMYYVLLDLAARKVPTQAETDGRILKRNGKVTEHGGWNSRTVWAILTNPRTAGHAVYRGEIIRRNAYKPIIPEETRQALIALRDDPTRFHPGGNTPKWLGSLIYLCGHCNDGTTMKQREKNGRPCYTCPTKGHCVHPAQEIDHFVTELLIERLGRDDISDLLPSRSTVDAAALREEALAIQTGKRTLHTRLVLNKIAEADYDEAVQVADKRLAEITEALSAEAPESPLAEYATSDDARATWKGQTLGQHREILKMLVTVTLLPVGRGRRKDITTWQRVRIDKPTQRRAA
ncbi:MULTISPECIES: recombinase family protein [unclassified Nonomuraea]|uniref:recombinase family protein n=1 Tax=unclassified Nonomuraea TaxID=2593643 RepID=UPI0033FB105B